MEPSDVRSLDQPRAAAQRARSAHTSPASSRRRSRRGPDLTPWGVGLLAAAAALAAAGAECRPLANEAADPVVTAAFAALVTVVSANARRWTWLLLAGVAAVGATTWPTLLAAAGAVVLAVYAAVRMDRRSRLVGAAVGALGVQVLLRLPEWRVNGLSALVAAATVVPVFVSAYRLARRRTRRRLLLGVAAGAGLVGVVLAIFALNALSGRSHAVDAMAEARAGFEAVRSGDRDLAVRRFDAATAGFGAAESDFASPAAQLVRLVPAVGQNQRAAAAMASSGQALSRAASRSASSAPFDRLVADAGRVDLALLASMREPVDGARAALAAAEAQLATVDSSWLVPQLAGPLRDFEREVADAAAQADLAAEGTATAPWLLGDRAERHYLVLFGTPAEARFLGGFVGAFAELGVADGKVTLNRSGSIIELSNHPDAEDRRLTGLEDYRTAYGRYLPTRYLQNLSASPDFPSVAEAARQLYPQAGGRPVDGVLYIDPAGMAALLRLTGPVSVAGVAEPLSADNVERFLLREQYVRYPVGDARADMLARTTQAAFEALTTRKLAGPRTMGDVLGPAVAQGRLMFTVTDERADAFLGRLGLRDPLPTGPSADYLSVRTANGGASKIDAYLDREVEHAVVVDDAAGTREVVTTVRLTNTAPAGGLPDYVIGNTPPAGQAPAPKGTNITDVALWSNAPVTDVAVDGDSRPFNRVLESGLELTSTRVLIAPGATVTVVFRSVGPEDGRALLVAPQPAAGRQRTSVVVTRAGASDGASPATAAPAVVWEGSEARRVDP